MGRNKALLPFRGRPLVARGQETLPSLLELLAEKTEEAALVTPCGPHGPEPLCAVYGKGCLPLIEELLRKGDFSLMKLISRLRTREIPREEVASVDPEFRSFRNINTPADFRMLSAYDQ